MSAGQSDSDLLNLIYRTLDKSENPDMAVKEPPGAVADDATSDSENIELYPENCSNRKNLPSQGAQVTSILAKSEQGDRQKLEDYQVPQTPATCRTEVKPVDETESTCEKTNSVSDMSKEEVTQELLKTQKLLEITRKSLARTERQLEKSDSYNTALRNMVEQLSSELHRYKNSKLQSTFVQVDVEDLLNYTTGEYMMPSWDAQVTQSATEAEEHDVSLSMDTSNQGALVGPLSIADSIKATAEAVVQQQTDEALASSGYVYDMQSGLYYHPESGYYYSNEKGLYYDPSSYTYFYYDYDKGEYQFHSRVNPAQYYNSQELKQHNKKEKKKKKKKVHDEKKSKNIEGQDDRPDMRLWDFLEAFDRMKIAGAEEARRHAVELGESWPPCVRAIVIESDCVDKGMLYLVTCAGATIGREGEGNHDIPLPDINISKIHAKVQYNEELEQYEISDKGSQNGTFINEERLSQPKAPSTAQPIVHGDVIQIGSTKLLCHIHRGTDTCDDCEPGVVMARHKATLPHHDIQILTAEEKKKVRRQELNKLKKKYGLKNAHYEENRELYNNPNYADRAEERRVTVGSDSPAVQHTAAPASVHRPISSENIGHKLLQKMGWKEGESLGKHNSGIQEPISVTLRANQAAGLGSAFADNFSADDASTVDMKKASRRAQAQQRFNRLVDEPTREDPDAAIREYSDTATAGIPGIAQSVAKTGGLKWTKGETEFT